MILRRFMTHVTDQNWFAVGLDVIVVIVGVYLGVYMGELASERAIQADVRKSLEVVHTQLTDDLANVEAIIQFRDDKLAEPVRALKILDQPDFDQTAFSAELKSSFERMYTYFPKTSGYTSMKDRGFLGRLDDAATQEALARLFDQVYERHKIAAEESDQNTFFYVRNVIVEYWNIKTEDFIGDEEVAKARLQNALFRNVSYSSWYVQFLKENVRPTIKKTLLAIERYQSSSEKDTP